MTGRQRIRSIDDLARLAGVSKSTVSRALNDSPLISVETKRRIVELAKSYDFVPSDAARSLSRRASRTVAYVIDAYDSECGLESPFSLEIMGAAATGLRERGYDMLVCQADDSRGDWAAEYLRSGRVDGFLVMVYEERERYMELLADLGAPFAVWGAGASGRGCSVSGDNRCGGYLAGAHLASIGRSRLAFLGVPCHDLDDDEAVERLAGFRDACADSGSSAVVAELPGDFSEESGYEETVRLIDAAAGSGAPVDGLFAAGDLMAIGAMRALAERGLRVPEDVAVVGYDDLFVSAFTTPALTTVSQHIAESGRALARGLVAMIEGGTPSETVIPVELVRRRSA